MVARSLSKAARAGSGVTTRYSARFLGATWASAARRQTADFAIFMGLCYKNIHYKIYVPNHWRLLPYLRAFC